MGFMCKMMKHRGLQMHLVAAGAGAAAAAAAANQTNRILTMEGQIIERNVIDNDIDNDDNDDDIMNTSNHLKCNMKDLDDSSRADSVEDKEQGVLRDFTTEHILQLCKFLADKSKSSKNLYKQQQSPKKVRRRCQGQQDSLTTNNKINHENVILNAGRKEESDVKIVCEQTTTSTTTTFLSNHFGQSVLTARFIRNNRNTNNKDIQQQHTEQPEHQLQSQCKNFTQRKQLGEGKKDILLKIRHQIYERRKLREQHYQSTVLHPIQVWRPW